MRSLTKQQVEKAAMAGEAPAMVYLALLILDEEPDTAKVWFNRAMQSPNRQEVMRQLSVAYCESDSSGRMRSLQRLARLGEPNAVCDLGWTLKPDHPAEADECFQKAAEAGYVPAMAILGRSLHFTNPVEAERWDRKAAQSGHLDAMYNLGVVLSNRGEMKEARVWWHEAAEQGNPSAMRALGRDLRCRHRSRAARRWLERAAEKGDSAAMVELALGQWRRGIVLVGPQSPPPGSRQMMQRAADLGNANAMWFLALWAWEGNNEKECQHWLHEGAARGDRACKHALEHGIKGNFRALRRLQNRPPEPSTPLGHDEDA